MVRVSLIYVWLLVYTVHGIAGTLRGAMNSSYSFIFDSICWDLTYVLLNVCFSTVSFLWGRLLASQCTEFCTEHIYCWYSTSKINSNFVIKCKQVMRMQKSASN